MKTIDPNYEPPENELEKFPDGEYKAKGWEWFTVDDNTKKPILVAQKNERLVARCRFELEDGKTGPPMSVELGEVALLVKAFGGDINGLPKVPQTNQPDAVSSFLETAEKLSKTSKIVPISVRNGWVNEVKGMTVPAGYFYFYLIDVFPKEDGKPIHKQGQYRNWFICVFRIEAGEGGSETPFKGATFTEFVSYAVQVEEGKPDWERTKETKQYSAAAVRLSNLFRLTAPALFEGSFEPPDAYNLLPFWSEEALKEKRILKASRVKNDKGDIRLLWASLDAVEGYTSKAPLENKEQENLKESDKKARGLLRDLFNLLNDGETVEDNVLNKAGIDLARKYISPIKQSGKVKHGSFKDLDYDDVLAIFNHVQETNDDHLIKEMKENLILASVGFDPPEKTGDEWGDSPF